VADLNDGLVFVGPFENLSGGRGILGERLLDEDRDTCFNEWFGEGCVVNGWDGDSSEIDPADDLFKTRAGISAVFGGQSLGARSIEINNSDQLGSGKLAVDTGVVPAHVACTDHGSTQWS
jgi:hypothetical protein